MGGESDVLALDVRVLFVKYKIWWNCADSCWCNWLGGYTEGFGRGGFESITYTHELDSGADEILLVRKNIST